ncbi:DUF3987 domain-containing protein [Streptomyces sp. NPDC050564]|uniref:DUF3987 domain-containing protein n=1 Tax=Streptomyces sp. NPDC050564 TaxID=3365631 RepID=UPI0037A7E8FF
MNLYVPEITEEDDVISAAFKYAGAGWYLLPVDPTTKNPGSIVGDHWQDKSSRDPEMIALWFTGTNAALALHMGRSGALAFDVDRPESLPDDLRDVLTGTGAPHQSTRVDQPGRGHYVFAQPEGRNIGNSRGDLGRAWGDVRGKNGVIVVAPSTHTREGGHYQWQTTGILPVLPAAIADRIPDAGETVDAATDEQVASFLADHTGSGRPWLLRAKYKRLQEAYSSGESRHEATVRAVVSAMREAAAGQYKAKTATDGLRTAFITAMRTSRDGVERTVNAGSAAMEFAGILAWAVAQVTPEEIEKTLRELDRRVGPPMFNGEPSDDEAPETRTAPAQNDSSNSSEDLWGPEDASDGISGTENEGGGPCWDTPLPVPRHTLPPFPTELLGVSLAAWVRAQGASLNVSDDLLALSALGTISAALGGRVQVKVKDGWDAENVCLYCLGLADSSARKTPALDAASAPMRDRIGQLREDHRAEVEQVEQEIRITEKELAAVENDVSRSKATKEDARAVLDTLLELKAQPGLPKAFVGDVTLEALGKVMGENGGRMALHESEAGFFKACAGLYGNGRADITLVLKAYSGTGHEIDRVGRGHSWMPRTALTLTLIIQPGVVEHMEKDNPEFKSSGFLNRFLYALPSPMPPGAFDTPDVPLDVSLDYAQRIVRLVDDVWTSENIRTLTLTAQARKVFAEFYNQTEKDKADGGALHDVAEWAGKLCGQIIRLAACLSLYDNTAAGEISEDAMTRSIGLAPYLTAHARAAFGLMSRDGDGGRKLLRDILDRLPQLLDDDRTVTTRKIRESFKGRRASGSAGAVDAEAIKDAMDELEELGWVAEIPAPPRKPGQRGQKPSPKYDVHPWIYDPPEEA